VYRNGITSTHLGFIKRGHIIILCFALRTGEQLPLEYADITFAVSDNKPCIIVVCCNPIDENQVIPFPTVIQTAGYSPPALESTAALIFGEGRSSRVQRLPELSTGDSHVPKLWQVEQWNEIRDIASVLELWNEDINGKFALDQETLASLLRRPGYAKHYVVRDTRSGHIHGFCATYLAYVDKEGEKLIASLAVLLVHSSHRQLGIGLSLHSHAVSQLKRTRGVIRLQFGSTFPRLLYGPPFGIQFNEAWFRRRGWQLDKENPGQGQLIYDLILDLSIWKHFVDSSSKMTFKQCSHEDMMKVIEIVEDTSSKQAKMGWFDQYTSMMNGPNVKDVVLAVVDKNVVAAALTYTPSCGSPIPSNLPWAGRIGDNVGGVTCICVSREFISHLSTQTHRHMATVSSGKFRQVSAFLGCCRYANGY
jgi:GNAT superfamily N-acetyltransferase